MQHRQQNGERLSVAIIGAGIFALAGTAAAGESARVGESIVKTPVLNFIIAWIQHTDLVFGRPAAGPAVALSFVVAAIACGFAALCYSELAAMIPVSGSAYTYSYATLGEIIAWIIGWDLILEYAVGNMAVAVGWAGYFVQLCANFGIRFPLWLVSDYTTASTMIAKGGDALSNYSSITLPVIAGHSIAFNLPAFLIVAAVTALLFTVGKFLVGLYLGKAGVASSFGVAGSLAVLLMWVYYSAQIFLLGAEFTWVYAHRMGSRKAQDELPTLDP